MADQLHDSHDIPAYVYTPLQKEHDEIRILVLEPAWDHGSPIHVSFEVLNSSQRSSYEALSYTWGDLSLTSRVLVDQVHQLPITQNLDQVLRRLRQKAEKRRLWIDALCINQSDDKEKSSQIPQMHSIYHDASNVVAWLGAGGEAETVGMRLLQQLSRWPRAKVEEIETQKEHHHFSYSQEANIAALLSLPWFTRMWIIQEVVFNVDVRLMCGSEEISWVRSITALELYQKIRRRSATRINRLTDKLVGIAAISGLWKQHSMFVGRRYSRKGRILEMLQEFAQYQCSDPRDRIFSLYNMATDIGNSFSDGEDSDGSSDMENSSFDSEDFDEVSDMEYLLSDTEYSHESSLDSYEDIKTLIEFDVDYTLDVRDTYHSFALACARAGKIHQLLQAVVHHNTFTEPTHWPSWVPDWRLKPVPQEKWSRTGSGPLLRYISHDNSYGLLLQSSRSVESVSQDPTQEGFACIDYICAPVTATDSMDDITRKIKTLYRVPSEAIFSKGSSGLDCFADFLAGQLNLTSEATSKLKYHLSKNIPAGDTTRENDTWEENAELRHIIVDAMKGKRWFRVCNPKYRMFLCGITNTSIVTGDELLLDNTVSHSTKASLGTAIIVRRTSTMHEAAHASSRYSYRVIGSALCSLWMLGDLIDFVKMLHSTRQSRLFDFWLY